MEIDNKFNKNLYLVTDKELSKGRPLKWIVEEAVKGGVDLVQLRDKDASKDEIRKQAHELADVLVKYDVPLLINDFPDIAEEVGAQGFHIGQNDKKVSDLSFTEKSLIVGVSIDKPYDLYSLDQEVVDYIALSPIYKTPTKSDTHAEWGLTGIRRVRARTQLPIVAIGRVNSGNARNMLRSGADCLAVVSAICSADSPAHAAEELRNIIDHFKSQKK
ncbi:MAG: thiamine phosphate synthase [Cyclobacteriaceae bacterium]|nr:thiamine phosphate synthase [Cyclobacteriaceae bacterium]MCH8517599.1 thiamine phosphate synthase [Cyclobacteriaceae bacterium]